jgi:hypothetical protein
MVLSRFNKLVHGELIVTDVKPQLKVWRALTNAILAHKKMLVPRNDRREHFLQFDGSAEKVLIKKIGKRALPMFFDSAQFRKARNRFQIPRPLHRYRQTASAVKL